MNEKEAAERAHHYLQRAITHQRAGRLGYAMRDYRRALALFPTPEAHTLLGLALSKLGLWEEAIEHCYQAIALDPDYGNPYNDIGAYLIELGRWEEAAPWFDLALSAPRYQVPHFAHFNLGRVHEHWGRLPAALAAYQAALQYAPTFQPARRARAALLARLN